MLFAAAVSPSQHYKFRIYLSDKGNIEYSPDNPTEYLSKKSVERKMVQNVLIDETDFPISADYFTLIEKAGGRVVSFSKWLKTVVVQVGDTMTIDQIASLSFVDSVKYVWRGGSNSNRHIPRPRLMQADSSTTETSGSIYGYTESQFRVHNGDKMHDAGFRGRGIEIGVIDAGFTNVDVIPAFGSTELLGYGNFVPEGDIFASSEHGTKVLSVMAANLPGQMMGSAPDAAYLLLRSEDVASEYPVEEDYWVRAVEYADSVGVDIINTSLGYSHFDDKLLNYSHDDLTGTVSIMSQAADMAYDKGLLNVVSVGNEGNKIWQKSTPPGDAKNVLAVGAVAIDSVIAPFSSYGLMADGRIKPDFVSVGKNSVTIGHDGTIGKTDGTSFSSPFLAGLIASLWSVNPKLHRSELIDIIKRSSDRYASPDSLYGYGIPDFQKALNEMLQMIEPNDSPAIDSIMTIQPAEEAIWRVELINPLCKPEECCLTLLDQSGGLISKYHFESSKILYVGIRKEEVMADSFIYFVLNSSFGQHTYKVKLLQ